MNRLTKEQRIVIVQRYYENARSVRACYRALRGDFGQRGRPSELAIRRIIDKFERDYTLLDSKPPTRQRNARSAENIVAVRESVNANANVSVVRRSQQLGFSPMSTWRILKKDLGLHPYKLILSQELKPADHGLRRTFTDWALLQLEQNADFGKQIIFSDEAHFWLNGVVNTQNCRFWCENNPRQLVERPLHPMKVTVWCGLHAGGIIGPYFFEDADGHTVTVNAERYRDMITNFLWPIIDTGDLGQKWFQQDGATSHTARETMNLLRERFEERIISRHGPINWPPRSCDLTPLDFFLWGYVKSLVYTNNPQTSDDLKVNITRVIREIQPNLLERVIENWVRRLDVCRRSRGGHLNDVLFKT